jgi:hypothetical protein
MYKLYGVIVFFILALILIFSQHQSYLFNNLLAGFWESDKSFCEESGLDMFCLYFDEDYNMSGGRACYVLASQNNEVILNEPTVAEISLQIFRIENWTFGVKSPKYFNINFQNISDDAEEIFPKTQQMRFYPVCNKIVLFYDDTITAVLYKNPINTELKTILESVDDGQDQDQDQDQEDEDEDEDEDKDQ